MPSMVFPLVRPHLGRLLTVFPDLPRYPRYPRYPLPVTPNQSSSHARSLCKGNRILCTTTLSYHILMPLPLTRLSRSTFLRASNIYSVGTLKPSMTHPFSTSVIPTK